MLRRVGAGWGEESHDAKVSSTGRAATTTTAPLRLAPRLRTVQEDVDLTEMHLHWSPRCCCGPPSSLLRALLRCPPTARRAVPLAPTLVYRCNVMMCVEPCVRERLSDSSKDWEGGIRSARDPARRGRTQGDVPALEGLPTRCKLAQLVAHHLRRDADGDVLLPVVDEKSHPVRPESRQHGSGPSERAGLTR